MKRSKILNPNQYSFTQVFGTLPQKMKIKSTFLLYQLGQQTQNHIQRSKEFLALPDTILNLKVSDKSWSILECLEHLNLYAEYYLPEIEYRMIGNNTSTQTYFRSGIIGDYFVKSMLPKGQLKPMKTAADKNPAGSILDRGVVKRFILKEERLLTLLDRASKVSLTKTRTSISVSRLIKLRLGDTLRFVVAHNERHLQQAERLL